MADVFTVVAAAGGSIAGSAAVFFMGLNGRLIRIETLIEERFKHVEKRIDDLPCKTCETVG